MSLIRRPGPKNVQSSQFARRWRQTGGREAEGSYAVRDENGGQWWWWVDGRRCQSQEQGHWGT